MKKAVTLIEVIFSILLISVVIVLLLSTQQNNLHIIEHTSQHKNKLQYANSIAIVSKPDFSQNKTIYLTDIYSLKDDEIRRELKEVKFKLKDQLIDTKTIMLYDQPLTLNIYKSLYTIKDENISKPFYGITIE